MARIVVMLAAMAVATVVMLGHQRTRPRAPGMTAAIAGAAGELDALARVARGKGAGATAAYVAAELRRLGYAVTVQPVAADVFSERRPPVVESGKRRLRAGADVLTLAYSGAGDVSGPARAVARPGCAARDFARLRRGDVALVPQGRCTPLAKAQAAQRAGAAAVLVVAGGRAISGTLRRPGVRIPAAVVSATAARWLRGRVHVAIDASARRATGENVLAEIGRGRRVAMAGAPIDDAGGVAVLLDAARRLAVAPPRSGVARLGFWTADDDGLVGSRRYLASLPAAERGRIAAYLDLDVASSPRARGIVVAGNHTRARRLLRAHLPGAARTRLGAVSDQAAFARAGIRVAGVNVNRAQLEPAAAATAGVLAELAGGA